MIQKISDICLIKHDTTKVRYVFVLTNDYYKLIVREEIKEELRLKTDNAFMLRRSGVYHHKPCEITAIEKVFNKYGVINPWGE